MTPTSSKGLYVPVRQERSPSDRRNGSSNVALSRFAAEMHQKELSPPQNRNQQTSVNTAIVLRDISTLRVQVVSIPGVCRGCKGAFRQRREEGLSLARSLVRCSPTLPCLCEGAWNW